MHDQRPPLAGLHEALRNGLRSEPCKDDGRKEIDGEQPIRWSETLADSGEGWRRHMVG
jgi:hypothetical protein